MIQKYNDLEVRWDNFIEKFETFAPKTYKRKDNVFRHMLSSTRTKKKFVDMAENTRPFVSKELWNLMGAFMEFMSSLPDQEGSNYRTVYKGMSPADLVKRLVKKRPVVFYSKYDKNVLRFGPPKLLPGKGKWENVAKSLDKTNENYPFLREYISYDEILLAAFVNFSTPTYFISDGSLKSSSEFVPEGFLCGLVGARLQKDGFMESRFAFPRDPKDKKFEDVHKSDKFWITQVYQNAFPEGKIPTHHEITRNSKIYKGIYEDGVNVVFLKKRLRLTVVPFVEEAIARGKENKARVVVSVPPIGEIFLIGVFLFNSKCVKHFQVLVFGEVR